MTKTVADFVLARLAEWGIERVFGYPGDGINGLIGAFGRPGHGLRFILSRHEEESAFMACGHAKFTGQVGVCMATSGPGAIHLLNGLYDAKLDHQPVVAIVGQQARTALGGDFQQEVDLVALFKDVARDYVQVMSTAEQARHLVDRAVRIALEQRSVTCIVIPTDVQDLPAVPVPPHSKGMMRTGIGAVSHAHVPGEDALHNAAAVLNRGRKVAILAGAGALGASEELAAVADRLGAGVAKALLGKAVLSDHLPYVTGSIGLLGTVPSWRLMQDCDTLLMIGTTFPYTEFLPPEGQAAGVQIDRDGRSLGLRYPIEVGLVGDAKQTLAALLPLLTQQTDLEWRHNVEDDVARWREVVEARAATQGNGVNPQLPFLELSKRLPDDSIVACDSGSATNWYARDVDVRPGMLGSVSGGLATMGCALPYGVAGKFAWPSRPVVALVGDGTMQMNGINTLITVADQWQSWDDPRFIVLVLNNGDLNLVTWEQRIMGGDPRFHDSQCLPSFSYAAYSKLLGLEGIRVTTTEEVAPALDRAFAADRPVLVEIMADPEMPPLPPHVTPKQFATYFKAMRKDPAGGQALRATLKQWWAG